MIWQFCKGTLISAQWCDAGDGHPRAIVQDEAWLACIGCCLEVVKAHIQRPFIVGRPANTRSNSLLIPHADRDASQPVQQRKTKVLLPAAQDMEGKSKRVRPQNTLKGPPRQMHHVNTTQHMERDRPCCAFYSR
jgi:hypothetical protein